MKVMLFAAGLGTRLKPVTDVIPKPAIPLLNIPLIAYPFEVMRALNPSQVVINTHHLPEVMAAAVTNLGHWDCPVKISFETPEILGSGGGLFKARALLSGDGVFAAANGDEVFLPQDPEILKKALEYHELEKPVATLVVMEHPLVGTQFGGIWCDDKMRVIGIGKTPPCEGLKGYHFTGFQILSEEVFRIIPVEGASNIFYDVFNPNFSKGLYVQAILTKGAWYEVGNSQDLIQASRALFSLLKDPHGKESNSKASGMRVSAAGVRMLEELRTRYRRGLDQWIEEIDGAQMLRSKTSVVERGVKLRGCVAIGDGARLLKGCELEDVIVCPGATVGAGVRLSKTVII